MKRKLLLISVSLFSSIVSALEVDREVMPRVLVGGELFSTFDIKDYESIPDRKATLGIHDSSIHLKMDKKLFNDAVGGAVVSFKESNTNAKFNQLSSFYVSQEHALKFGRTTLPNTMIEFPLLRHEDLLSFTHVGNASSNEEFDQQYGKNFQYTWFFDRENQGLDFFISDLSNEAAIDKPNGFNNFGVGYQYAPNEDVHYVQWVRYAGIRALTQRIRSNGENQHITSVIGGIDSNLNLNPERNWSGAFQFLYSNGLNHITSNEISDTENHVSNQARAKYYTLVGTVRYTARPMLLTRWQAAISVALKKYRKINNASSYAITPHLSYRLGMGFDLVSQYRHIRYKQGVFNGKTDHIFQIGLVFDFDMHFNNTFTDRNSIIRLKTRNMR